MMNHKKKHQKSFSKISTTFNRIEIHENIVKRFEVFFVGSWAF